jgi:hypothetical protein
MRGGLLNGQGLQRTVTMSSHREMTKDEGQTSMKGGKSGLQALEVAAAQHIKMVAKNEAADETREEKEIRVHEIKVNTPS